MGSNKTSSIKQLLQRHATIIISFTILALILLVVSSVIHHQVVPENSNKFLHQLADFFMTLAQTILGAGLIIGGFNLILEEFKQEQESNNRGRQYRQEMVENLQSLHSEVQLARVLIRTHKSAKTYGEQMRERILPAIIALKDLRRSAMDGHNHPLGDNKIPPFRVSLHFMIAYLSVLIEEFESNYHRFSNLQNCQEALATRMRSVFVELAESQLQKGMFDDNKIKFLEQAQELFEQTKKPQYVNEVWNEIEELPYTSDFIADTQNYAGNSSNYYKLFLIHYAHCKKILKFNQVDPKVINLSPFSEYKDLIIKNDKIDQNEQIENSNSHNETRVSLTRKIMQDQLGFEFKKEEVLI